jgi:hypothetical protein
MKAKWIVMTGLALGLGAVTTARADDCLEVGWRDQNNNWTYYRAWMDEPQADGRVHIRYDYHHGELELKVHEKEGGDVYVLKGRWFEGRDGQRSGRVFMRLEQGHHRAKGWYTYGDDENGSHYDFALRDCKR